MNYPYGVDPVGGWVVWTVLLYPWKLHVKIYLIIKICQKIFVFWWYEGISAPTPHKDRAIFSIPSIYKEVLDLIHAVRHCRSETALIVSYTAFIYKVNGNKSTIIANIVIPCYLGFSLHATLAWLQTFLPVFLRPIYNCFR